MENIIDWTDYENDFSRIFADKLFRSKLYELTQYRMMILLEDGMEVIDLFCILLEIFLYGWDILSDSKNSIFDLQDIFDDIVIEINSYLKMIGYEVYLEQLFDDQIAYYCQIYKSDDINSHDYISLTTPWNPLSYYIVNNIKAIYHTHTPLKDIYAIFKINQKVYQISFDFKNI